MTSGAVLITGTSTGIGEACCAHLHALGCEVFAGVRNEADGDRLRREVGTGLTPVLLDVTDGDAIASATATITGALDGRGLVGVVNNAEAVGESLRHELRPSGMHVAVVEPGTVKTEIWKKGKEQADKVEAALPPEARERYGALVGQIRRSTEVQERLGIPPLRVAKAVEHALFAARPRARYLVGPDAKTMGVLSRFAPDRTKDAIVRTLTRLYGRPTRRRP